MAKKKITLKVQYKVIKTPYFEGIDLTIAREKAGLSQAKMAKLCDWSRTHQHLLELPIAHSIDEPTLRIINEALNQD